MSRRGALVQQRSAVEALAAVDVVCLDKTGTLTEPQPRVLAVIPADAVERADLERALGRYAASARSRTATLEAIAASYRAQPEQAQVEVPFASRRRWSALQVDGRAYVLGAPELSR